nr:hypothetical protein [Prescottella equi]
MESDDIEVGIGREYTYPGYHDAAGSNRTMGNKTWTDDPADPVGTLHLKIVLGEVTPTSVDAVVCRDETGLTRGGNGHYPVPPTTQTFGLWATRVAVEMSESVHETAPETSSSPRVDLREPVLPRMTGPQDARRGRERKSSTTGKSPRTKATSRPRRATSVCPG